MPKLPGMLMSNSAVACATCVLIFLTFIPLSFLRFAFLDDYPYMVIHAYRAINPFLIGDGRPLGGLSAVALFTIFDTVSSAAFLRLIGLFELIAVLFLVQRAAVMAGLDAIWAAFVAIAFATAPSIQHWVVWGVSSWQLPALIFGVAAYFPWRNLVDADGRVSVVNVAWFMALPLVGMLIYQPFATAAWPLIAIDVMMRRENGFPYRKLFVALVAFCAMLLLTFAISKILIVSLVPSDGKVGRIAIVGVRDLPAKLDWFLRVPLTTALTPLHVHGSAVVASVVSSVILIGLAMSSRSVGDFGLALLLMLCVLALSNLPSLVPPENTVIRSHVVLALQVFAMLGLSLQMLTRRMKSSRPVLVAAVVSCCLAMSVWAGSTVVRYNAFPQALELALIEGELAKTKMPEDIPLVLVGLPHGSSLTGRYCDDTDMMGCASSQQRSALPNIVRLWMRAHGIDPARYKLMFMHTREDPQAVSFEHPRAAIVAAPDKGYFLDLGGVVLQHRTPR
jgi:hypothetical protein